MTTIARSGSSRAMASAASRRFTAISVGVCPSSRTWPAVTFNAPGSSSARRILSARCPFSLPTLHPPLGWASAYTGRYNAAQLATAHLPPRPVVRPSTPALVSAFERHALSSHIHAAIRATSMAALVTVAAEGEHEAGRVVNRAEQDRA